MGRAGESTILAKAGKRSKAMDPTLEIRSKLDLPGDRVSVAVDEVIDLVAGIFRHLGCRSEVAREVAEHLADANLCGMESHGLMRCLQYAEQFETGYMDAGAEAEIVVNGKGATLVDGHGGIGIPAMRLEKRPAFLESKFTITKQVDLTPYEETQVLLSLLMMLLLERRRG